MSGAPEERDVYSYPCLKIWRSVRSAMLHVAPNGAKRTDSRDAINIVLLRSTA